uniref:Myosin light chain kinase family, member 4b n=1 Tax=Cyprinus carpio TaxID=7962 RepID=A0A8C1JXL4_CYPCA
MSLFFLLLFFPTVFLFSSPFQDLVQAGFEEVQKLNQQNSQLSQCTAETAVSTAVHLDLIEEEQEVDKYRERKDDKQQATVEEEARGQEIAAELFQIKEEDKNEEEDRLKKEEALWLPEEKQLALHFLIFPTDSSPPPPAPFEHCLVTTKTHQITSYYTINKEEVLGGGRFGMVHKCVEKSSGLVLAAKIIKARSQKEKEVVKCEIEVMNQLDHANLIQLYAAFESRHEIILVMEYVDGGELFDRIIDENYKLTELDTVLFIRQISEGLQYMHKMYILHLDLKPENILCVSRQTNKVKIIDFGLAMRYKPREKLRVNFGTPEFLAPEVINYEFVSFPTDMWSLGVITYMLLSGLSPFLGEDDNETLNNILACQWSFEEAEFADISEEAKDFISRLLVKSKSWRMSASQSLKHPWLSDRALHYRLHHKVND